MQQSPWTYLNPYDRRFGPEFFKQVPEKTGVYWMLDARRSLLFVGSTLNLRERLSSYRFIKAQNSPKRLLHLLEEVRSLDWTSTETLEAARLLEAELIRRHTPLYNSNSPAEKHAYVLLLPQFPILDFTLISARNSELKGRTFGVFKNRAACNRALSSLCRLLWWFGHQGRFHLLPKPLAKPLTASGAKLDFQLDFKSFELVTQFVEDYWEGQSDQLLQLFEETLMPWTQKHADAFFTNWVKFDIQILKAFYQQGPKRNQKMKQLLQVPGKPPEARWVDELVIMA